MSGLWPNLRNYIALQLLWLAAVSGAGRGSWWAAPLALAVFAALHFGLHWQARGDAALMMGALVLGGAVDSVMAGSGLLRYTAPVPSAAWAPVWILSLWMGLGLTLNHSFGWLMRRPAWAVPVMAIGGPVSYWGAQASFGAVHFSAPASAGVLTLGALWGAATGVLIVLAARLKRPLHAAWPR